MRVIISGAGIAGNAAAWWLAKAGAQVTVLEKASALLPHGQNVDIEGSALKVLDKMSLLEEVKRAHTSELGTQFIDPQGRPFAPFPISNAGSFTSNFEILRGDLAKILWTASKNESKTKFLLGTIIKEVVSNDEKSVRVQLSKGDNLTEMECDVLIAADGQWSKIRKSCFKPEDVTVKDKGVFAVYHTVPRIPSDNLWWNIYLATGSRLVSCRPDPHGGMRASYTFMPRNAADKAEWDRVSRADRSAKQALMRKQFAGAGWQTDRFLDGMDAPDFYFQAVQQIRMKTWHNNRVVCLGDTAWAPTPFTGIGTSLAITGAYVLAGELSKLQPDQHPSAAFEQYEKVFQTFVIENQHIPFFIPSIVHPYSETGRTFLRYFIRTAHSIFTLPWITKRFAQKKDVPDDATTDFLLPKYRAFERPAAQV